MERHDDIVTLLGAGYTMSETKRLLGVSYGNVWASAKKIGYVQLDGDPRRYTPDTI